MFYLREGRTHRPLKHLRSGWVWDQDPAHFAHYPRASHGGVPTRLPTPHSRPAAVRLRASPTPHDDHAAWATRHLWGDLAEEYGLYQRGQMLRQKEMLMQAQA